MRGEQAEADPDRERASVLATPTATLVRSPLENAESMSRPWSSVPSQ